jgi:glutaredoxin 3
VLVYYALAAATFAGGKSGLLSKSGGNAVMIKVVMYTTATCSYCVAAKNLLVSRGLSYEEVRVDKDPAKLAEMLALAKRRTVPQIFINDRHIGGFDDLVKFDHDGDLAKVLNEDRA